MRSPSSITSTTLTSAQLAGIERLAAGRRVKRRAIQIDAPPVRTRVHHASPEFGEVAVLIVEPLRHCTASLHREWDEVALNIIHQEQRHRIVAACYAGRNGDVDLIEPDEARRQPDKQRAWRKAPGGTASPRRSRPAWCRAHSPACWKATRCRTERVAKLARDRERRSRWCLQPSPDGWECRSRRPRAWS